MYVLGPILSNSPKFETVFEALRHAALNRMAYQGIYEVKEGQEPREIPHEDLAFVQPV